MIFTDDKIAGRNPVIEALKSGRTVDKLFVQKDINDGIIVKICAMAHNMGIVISRVERQKLDHMTDAAHQGVVAVISMHTYAEIDDIFARAEQKGEPPFIIIAEEISDPHNLGSIIRTANICGAHGVIIPKNRAVGLSSVVAKVSAGALEYTPVARVVNIARTIEQLQQRGVWVAGGDEAAADIYYNMDYRGAAALVIGNEGKGISRLVKEKCDFLVSIPSKGEISSLNASVAAAALMLEVAKQRSNVK